MDNKIQLAEKLGISVSMVNKLMAKGMPYVKIGAAVRFNFEEVLAWLKSRKGE